MLRKGQLTAAGKSRMTIVPVTSADLGAAEVSWFSALCGDDYRYLGVPESALAPSWEHCRNIVLEAEKQGFRNVLCPSSYQVGQDVLTFVSGMAPLTEKINMLAAVRCGELHPLMLARTARCAGPHAEGAVDAEHHLFRLSRTERGRMHPFAINAPVRWSKF